MYTFLGEKIAEKQVSFEMGLRFVSVFGCVNVSEAFPSEIASVDGVKYLKWIRFWFAIDSITGSGSGKSLNGQVAEDCSC